MDAPTRTRDADRSRAAILDAAEAAFAERGYAGASVQAIADAAGLSRATPLYFFGSKADLHAAVLRRVHAAREDALRPAFAPLRAWAHAEPPAGDPAAGLDAALAAAVDGYWAMLDARPAFARLIEWEALAGGDRLGGSAGRSTAVVDALRAVRRASGRRGLAAFDPTAVTVAFVSLCFLPVAHRASFLHGGGIDTADAGFRTGYRDAVVAALRALLVAP